VVAEALERPVAGPPLEVMAKGRRRVTILVPDATRRGFLPEVLPELLARLAAAGVPEEGIAVLVACGTHPPVSAAQCAALLGPLPAHVRVAQHDSRDDASLVSVGRLASGLEIRLNRLVVECDLAISVSLVQHHYLAGFGGGPKMVFPGVAGYREIQRNHARVIDLSTFPPRRHPACEPGVREGNPVAEEIAAAAALRPVDLALVMVVGGDERPAWAASGPLEAVFPAACGVVREWYEVEAGPFRRLVVSASGAPVDDTLIQAHKALDAACRFAEPGAEVLFVAACGAGAGSPEMEPFLADPRPEAITARLAQEYVQYGHTTLRIVEKTARVHVLARTELDSELLQRLGMTPVADVEGVFERWREEEAGAVVGVMAGPAVFPKVPAGWGTA
jgi:nickel-dependent lactate racemase